MKQTTFLTFLVVLQSVAIAHAQIPSVFRLDYADASCTSSLTCPNIFAIKVNVGQPSIDISSVNIGAFPSQAQQRITNIISRVGLKVFLWEGFATPVFLGSGTSAADLAYELVVTAAYIAMPGLDPGTTILDPRLSFYRFQATAPRWKVVRVNTPQVVQVNRTGSKLVVEPVPYLDLRWQNNQVLRGGAIFTHFRLTTNARPRVLAVFIKLAGPPECPPEQSVSCPSGLTYVYNRTVNLCFETTCGPSPQANTCLPVNPLKGSRCAFGYQLSCWKALPSGCNTFRCDPVFLFGTISKGC